MFLIQNWIFSIRGNLALVNYRSFSCVIVDMGGSHMIITFVSYQCIMGVDHENIALQHNVAAQF